MTKPRLMLNDKQYKRLKPILLDAHGNPITFIITDGTTHDIKMAKDLVDKVDLSNVVMLSADKGYDSQDFRAYVEEKNACKHSTKIK